jgi:hypothetical protein
MPDLRPDKTGETGNATPARGFVKRRSGDPANRLRGCRDHQARPDRRGASAVEPKTWQPPDCRDQVGHREDGNGSSLGAARRGAVRRPVKPSA